MPFSIDPNKSSRQNLLDLVKYANPTDTQLQNLSTTQLGFYTPVVLTGGTRNTRCRIGGIIGLGAKGFKNIEYNRKSLASVITTPLATVDVYGVTATTLRQLLTAINAQTGLKLRQDEIVDGAIDLLTAVPGTITLTTTATSEIWLPGSTVTVNLVNNVPDFPAGTFLGLGDGEVLGLGDGNVLGI